MQFYRHALRALGTCASAHASACGARLVDALVRGRGEEAGGHQQRAAVAHRHDALRAPLAERVRARGHRAARGVQRASQHLARARRVAVDQHDLRRRRARVGCAARTDARAALASAPLALLTVLTAPHVGHVTLT
jgi:hypothetical protein